MNYGPASKYYDLFSSNSDIDFYKELAVKKRRRALELGVGTGRVAIELVKAGVNVLGIDNSPYMLSVARKKLRKENLAVKRRVTLELGDMRSFKTKETFPLIYIASSTFEHCKTREDQRKCLMSIYKALKKAGMLAFDISQNLERKRQGSWWVEKQELGKEEIVRTIFSKLNPQNNVVAVHLFFEVYANGKLKQKYYEYGEARISSKAEIEELLKDVGFEIENVYGDFDKSAYDANSKRAVFIARRR